MRKILILFISLSSLSLASVTTVQPEVKVYICISTGSYAYHSHVCQGLNRCTHERRLVTITEAKEMGYRPCGYCY